MIQIQVDEKKGVPLFRQIVEQITRAVREGQLKEGRRLPSERELSDLTQLSRGTVKKAYEELAHRGIVQIQRGRGTFVGSDLEPPKKPPELSRKEQALHLIEVLLETLEKMRFTPREIQALVHICMLERLEKRESIHIAAIDCNIETLSMFHQQLVYMKGVDLKKFLLSEVLQDPRAKEKLIPFRLILVTSTHYGDLVQALPSLEDRILQVAVAPSPETILELGQISPVDRVGILCESRTFSQIIQNKIRDLRIVPSSIETLFMGDGEEVGHFLQDKEVLIIPPGYSFPITKENKVWFQHFCERGGRIIQFEYRIERGSLLHLEERIRELWV